MNLWQVVGWISAAHPPFYADSVDALRLSTLRLPENKFTLAVAPTAIDAAADQAHDARNAANTAGGFSSPEIRRKTAAKRFFLRQQSWRHPLMGAPCGAASAAPVPYPGLLTRKVAPSRLAAGGAIPKSAR